MTNYHVKFSAKNFHSNGHYNGFPRALFFSHVQKNQKQVFETTLNYVFDYYFLINMPC